MSGIQFFERKIRWMELPLTSYIILIGPKNSGKTVFLTSFYQVVNDHPTIEGIGLGGREPSDIHKFFNNAIAHIKNGYWPPSTPSELNYLVKFDLTFRKTRKLSLQKTVSLFFPDIGGQLIFPPQGLPIFRQTELRREQKEIIELVDNASGYILFFDPQRENEGKLIADYIELINYLEEKGKADTPLLLLVTKCDLKGSTVMDEGAKTYIERNFKEISNQIKVKWRVKPHHSAVYVQTEKVEVIKLKGNDREDRENSEREFMFRSEDIKIKGNKCTANVGEIEYDIEFEQYTKKESEILMPSKKDFTLKGSDDVIKWINETL